MPKTELTSRKFNENTGRDKKAVEAKPVFITDRRRTTKLLPSITDDEKLIRPQRSIVDLLAMDEAGGAIEFEPPPLRGPLTRPADLD